MRWQDGAVVVDGDDFPVADGSASPFGGVENGGPEPVDDRHSELEDGVTGGPPGGEAADCAVDDADRTGDVVAERERSALFCRRRS